MLQRKHKTIYICVVSYYFIFFFNENPYNILEEYDQFVFSYRNIQQGILEQEEKKRREKEKKIRWNRIRFNNAVVEKSEISVRILI